MPKLSLKIFHEVEYSRTAAEQHIAPFRQTKFSLDFLPSCRDPGWYHPEQHAGRGRDREGARGDPQRDAGSRDQSAGGGLWLLACHCIPVHSFGTDHPGPHREHQVRQKVPFKCISLLSVKYGTNSLLKCTTFYCRTINRGDLMEYITTHYKGSRIVLAAAGGQFISNICFKQTWAVNKF